MLRLTAIGHLGDDAILKDVNGKKVLNFSIAHSEKYKDSKGVPTEKTIWVECAIWDSEKLGPYLKKGQQVYLEGSPDVRGWVDTKNNSGEVRATLKLTVFNLQLLGKKKEGSTNTAAENNGGG